MKKPRRTDERNLEFTHQYYPAVKHIQTNLCSPSPSKSLRFSQNSSNKEKSHGFQISNRIKSDSSIEAHGKHGK